MKKKISQRHRTCTELYILGLLYFEDDTRETVVLSRQQLASIGWIFVSTILGDTRPEPGDDDVYFKFKLSDRDNPIAFRKFLSPNLIDIVKEIQFGYYHHRVIFKLVFDESTKLHVIRDARAEAYQLIREKCFDHFTRKEIIAPGFSKIQDQKLFIHYIYSYTLIFIPSGRQVIDREQENILHYGYDSIFTTRTTTFGFYLSDHASKKSPLLDAIFRPKTHFIRISVPSIVVYLDDQSISQYLFANIVDAVYYGGLYQKIRADREYAQINNKEFEATDAWPSGLTLSVFEILRDSISTRELDDISIHIDRFALLVGIIALVLSTLLVFFQR